MERHFVLLPTRVRRSFAALQTCLIDFIKIRTLTRYANTFAPVIKMAVRLFGMFMFTTTVDRWLDLLGGARARYVWPSHKTQRTFLNSTFHS